MGYVKGVNHKYHVALSEIGLDNGGNTFGDYGAVLKVAAKPKEDFKDDRMEEAYFAVGMDLDGVFIKEIAREEYRDFRCQ